MGTNPQGTRPTNRPGEQPIADTTTTATPMGTTTGVGSVAVYDNDADHNTTSTTRPSTARMMDDRAPVETRSSGSILSWIIGAIVLIVLVYFLFQILF
jgi:hypothetical protein